MFRLMRGFQNPSTQPKKSILNPVSLTIWSFHHPALHDLTRTFSKGVSVLLFERFILVVFMPMSIDRHATNGPNLI